MGSVLTLGEWSEKYLRPSVLQYIGLPDTPEGNHVLDLLVQLSIENDNICKYLNKWRLDK